MTTSTTTRIPTTLLRQQLPNITAMLKGAVMSYLPLGNRQRGEWLTQQ